MKRTRTHSSRLTPCDCRHLSCKKTRAELRIYSDSRLSDEITGHLGIEPTERHDKGDRFTNSTGRTREAPSTGWFLSSRDRVSSNDLRDHLNWLLTELMGAEAAVRALQEDEETHMRIHCYWLSASGQGGPTLWPEQMESMAKLNLECDFDYYFLGEDHWDGWFVPSVRSADTGYGPRRDMESLIQGWPRAMERLKQRFGLPPGHCGTMYDNGDYVDDSGEVVGSLLDFLIERSKVSADAAQRDGWCSNCKETRAELRTYPGSRSAGDVTRCLGVEPTGTQEEGELFESSTSRVWKAPMTGWFLSSEGQVASMDLEDHVDWLLTKLAGAESALLALQEQEFTKMTVACVWWSADGHGGPRLTPAQMHALAKFNLECSFDVYFQGNSFGPNFDDYEWYG